MSTARQLPPEVTLALIRRERLALLGRLLRGVVHNISGAMQMLRLPLDLMELRLAQGETRDLGNKLSAMQQGMTRLAEEVDLLSARSVHGASGEPTLVDLSRLANEQLAFWRADMFFKHEVQLTQDLPTGGLPVRAAYADVALAFNLLLANALESLRASGAKDLKVRHRQQAGRALLSLADAGPGPRPEMIPVMFDPFTGDKEPPHDGLGLYLARQALLAAGGTVSWEEGDEPCFQISLPLVSV
jgi:two-component system C4-dicarboxylate transport sensor histidine kinase DctB